MTTDLGAAREKRQPLALYKGSLLQAISFFRESGIDHQDFGFCLEVNGSQFECLFSCAMGSSSFDVGMVGVQGGCLGVRTQIIASIFQGWEF